MTSNSQVSKKPLDLNLYQKYDIPQDYMAFEITFSDVTQMQCDDFEHEYYVKGYKIFHTSIERSTGDLFIYKLVVAKSTLTF